MTALVNVLIVGWICAAALLAGHLLAKFAPEPRPVREYRRSLQAVGRAVNQASKEQT